MDLIIAGQLFWRDDVYLLVDKDPVLEHGRHWMNDSMREFVVCSKSGQVYNLVVTPPFAVSYRRMGDKIQVKEKEAELDFEETMTKSSSEHWLDRLLKEEPASFAE
jgi:hypothetical protein